MTVTKSRAMRDAAKATAALVEVTAERDSLLAPKIGGDFTDFLQSTVDRAVREGPFTESQTWEYLLWVCSKRLTEITEPHDPS